MTRFTVRSSLPFPGRVAPVFAATLVLLMLLAPAAGASEAKQKTFASAEEAVVALVKATAGNDRAGLLALFGPGSETLVLSGDEATDRLNREQFVKSYREKNRLEKSPAGRFVLYIGNDDWPFPIPVAKKAKRWRFDTMAGLDEILSREIGENELATIQVCLAIADAQREFADQARDRTGQPEYAQKLESTDGRRDGLYWEAAAGEAPSPLGPMAAQARAEGYGQTGGIPLPYHGYLYRILKAQGSHAAGGAYDYLVDEKMIGGFALVAYPAAYGATGVNSFIVNHGGVVYRKDLGRNTPKTAEQMASFDPDPTWALVK